jgi:hypothetical protein
MRLGDSPLHRPPSPLYRLCVRRPGQHIARNNCASGWLARSSLVAARTVSLSAKSSKDAVSVDTMHGTKTDHPERFRALPMPQMTCSSLVGD